MRHLKGLSVAESAELIPDGTILLGYRGSIAHGTYRPASEPDSIDDKDLMGVYVAPLSHYTGFPIRNCGKAVEHQRGEWDVVHYEVRKFVQLLLNQNPNVLALLWIESNLYVQQTAIGSRLVVRRDVFSSKRAYDSFVGYARSQLARMERTEFHGRMGAKRKALVEQHGYDTKNAAHLIRLLRMGIEFLADGRLRVLRADAPELVSIKRGVWTLERVKREADILFAAARDALLASPLPAEPDRAAAERLCMGIVADSLDMFHDVPGPRRRR